jgi:hypothetical protein
MVGMRAAVLMLALILTLGVGVFFSMKHLRSNASAAKFPLSTSSIHTSKPDFDTQIKTIFQAKCQPCHFQGGQVYDKLPFDKAETITRLGTKLFTRIKDEKERSLIREFLDASNSKSDSKER